MSAAVLPKVLESCTLIYVEIDENSNKVWKGSVLEDGSFLAQWGRVGSQLQSTSDEFGSVILAKYQLARMKRQKLRKGYTEAQIIEADRPINVTVGAEELDAIAARQIHHGEDERARQLIRYLVETNIHQIVSQTKITYHVETGTWRTPLGLVTPNAIALARQYLLQIAEGNNKNSLTFGRLVSQYLRLIPQNLGKKLDDSIFRSFNELQRQQEILDALDAALQLTPKTIEEGENVFECKIRRVPGSIEWGREKFREIRTLYESTINANHLAANYKLKRVYEVDIPSMRRAFDVKASKIDNVKLHWHGTKASNLLSIFQKGLIIPPADAIQCTGRMFGNGIYGSEQSTKALNYATNYWNASGNGNQRVFMLLCEFAMGREYHPKNWSRSFPRPGYDSTNVQPGVAGVINQESIVYSIDQVNIKYLCEFEED
jgi:poly [ADP-ribose] polymerase 2/3/4